MKRVGWALVFLGACSPNSSPSFCPAGALVQVPIGRGAVLSGSLGAGTDEQIAISNDRQALEYRFSSGGTRYIARYELSTQPAAARFPDVVIRRSGPRANCAILSGRGPVIDAVEVWRGGARVATGDSAEWQLATCPRSTVDQKGVPVTGTPDGVGVALGDADALFVHLSDPTSLEPGDEVRVTVLDQGADPYEVLMGGKFFVREGPLGTLRGSGSVTVPPSP
jgi:hypothetical protein